MLANTTTEDDPLKPLLFPILVSGAMLFSAGVAARVLGNGPRLDPPKIDRGDLTGVTQYLTGELRRAEQSERWAAPPWFWSIPANSLRSAALGL